MDFLTTLYSNDNFGIILFITISILVLAFLVILFFGKKDQKERELAATKSVELSTSPDQLGFQENQAPTMMDIPIPPVPNITPSVQPPLPPIDTNINIPPIPPVPTNTDFPEPPRYVTNENMVNAEVPPVAKETPISYNAPTDFRPEPPRPVPNPLPPVYREAEVQTPVAPTTPKTDFDFDALAASISKELKSLENTRQKNEVRPPIEETPNLDETIRIPTFEPSSLPQNREPIPPIRQEVERRTNENYSSNFSSRIQPERKAPTGGAQFSSVFVSNKQEPSVPQMPNREINAIPEPIMQKPAPVKPNIELPKSIDLPKLNGGSKMPTKNNQSNIVFPSLENDIPTYNRNNENRM